MRPDRRVFFAAVLGGAVLAPWTAHAQDASFAAVSAPVAALDAGLLAVMKAGSSATPFPRRYAMLEPVISQSFNLPHILQFAVGFDWPSLNASQRQDLLAVFREYTVASYVSNFTSYDGQQFHILPGLRAVGAEQVISTQIVPRSGAPHRIDYVLQQNGASWQIVDVLLDGTISQVAVQRSDFGSLLSSGGAPSLIAGLKKKVMSLSGNTMS